MIGFVSLQYIRTLFLSETTSYVMVPMVFVIPPGEEYGDIEKFARPFDIKVWIIHLIVCSIGYLTVIVSRFSETIHNFIIGRSVKTPIINMIAVACGIPQTQLPKRNFARFLLMVYILYSLVFRSAYQGGIYKILQSSDRKPEVSSLKEMMEKNYAFHMYETLALRAEHFKFYERRVVFPNTDIGKQRMKTLDPRFRGVVFNYVDQIMYLNAVNHENFTFHICKERMLTNQFVFYFRKNHYLVDEMNAEIEKLLSNGIVNHYRSRYADARFLKPIKQNNERKVLTLQHFSGAFRVLMICFSIAFIVFLFELMTTVKKLKFRKRTANNVSSNYLC